ncbi:MAG: TrmO family methyltransferase [Halococcoides sp.]
MVDPPFVAVDIEPIGRIHPVGDTAARIDLDRSRVDSESLRGIDTFSHTIVVVHGDPPRWNDVTTGDRAPWDGTHPDPLAVTSARVAGTSSAGIELSDIRLLDDRPLVDAKPYMKEFGPFGTESQPFWLSEVGHDRSA